jgi:mitochondrial import receptor subunit TOM20
MLGYYRFFPSSSMNVSVKDNEQTKKKVLIAEKDFDKGDVIYKV